MILHWHPRPISHRRASRTGSVPVLNVFFLQARRRLFRPGRETRIRLPRARSVVEAGNQPLNEIVLSLERQITVDTGHEATGLEYGSGPRSLILESKAGWRVRDLRPTLFFLAV